MQPTADTRQAVQSGSQPVIERVESISSNPDVRVCIHAKFQFPQMGVWEMHKGSCHCGRILFEVEGDFSDVKECNCSHCSRKGYLLWFVPKELFRLKSGADGYETYKFNKHVISHHFCKTCGCAPFATGKAPTGVETVAINVRCLEGIDLTAVKRVPVDGRSF